MKTNPHNYIKLVLSIILVFVFSSSQAKSIICESQIALKRDANSIKNSHVHNNKPENKKAVKRSKTNTSQIGTFRLLMPDALK